MDLPTPEQSRWYFAMTVARNTSCSKQWPCYTRARQVKWLDWKINRPGSVMPIALLCFGTPNNEQKIIILPYMTADRFSWFILTVKQYQHYQRRWRPVFWRRQLKNGRQLFLGKKCIWVTYSRMFWPRNDLAPLLRWRRHWQYVHAAWP